VPLGDIPAFDTTYDAAEVWPAESLGAAHGRELSFWVGANDENSSMCRPRSCRTLALALPA
jgi:hypothetical protein